MWKNLRYTFTSPAQTDSAEWCAEQTVIALSVILDVCSSNAYTNICSVFELIWTLLLCWHFQEVITN